MNNPFSTKPFLFLLISLLVGIVLQYYQAETYWSILLFLSGGTVMLLSYLISKKDQYSLRWLFGVGVFLLLVSVGCLSTQYRQSKSAYTFSTDAAYYRGVVVDVPQEKAKTMAYKVRLADYDKQIICYIGKDSVQSGLQPGEEIFFEAAIQPFRNRGNPGEFDYVQYMHEQGFAGTAYLPNSAWLKTGKTQLSLEIEALRCREKLLGLYRSLNLSEEEFGILSALTLGYRDGLSEDMEQSFRATGTVHILSVSGLHVGIIYTMILFILFFIRRGSRYYWLKPGLVILLLWAYAYVTGLPPSVVRASAMLTVFCIAEIFRRKSQSIHSLYIAAFFMLLYNPMSLFDIGFQLSFLSVLSILYLHPKLSSTFRIKNRVLNYIWQLFTLSLVAQLATFPLCLYYFGTFPTYFFVANLIVVPLVSVIMYAFGVVLLAKVLVWLSPVVGDYILWLSVYVVKFLIEGLTVTVRYIESLPFSLIEDVDVSFVDLVLISAVILSFIGFWFKKNFRSLASAMSFTLVLLVIHLYNSTLDRENQLVVFNRAGITDVKWNKEHEDYSLSDIGIQGYQLIDLGGSSLLVIADNSWEDKMSVDRYAIDYLLLVGDNPVSIEALNRLFLPKLIILDGSLSKQTARRLSKECQKKDIRCYDVAEKGAFSINF